MAIRSEYDTICIDCKSKCTDWKSNKHVPTGNIISIFIPQQYIRCELNFKFNNRFSHIFFLIIINDIFENRNSTFLAQFTGITYNINF